MKGQVDCWPCQLKAAAASGGPYLQVQKKNASSYQSLYTRCPGSGMKPHLEQQLWLESPFDEFYNALLSFPKVCTGQRGELNKDLIGIDILCILLVLDHGTNLCYCDRKVVFHCFPILFSRGRDLNHHIEINLLWFTYSYLKDMSIL